MNNRPMSLMIGGTLGIIGALIAWNYAAIGVPMIIGAAALVYFAVRGKPNRHTVQPMMIGSPVQEQKMEGFLKEPSTNKMMRALRHKLYNAGIAPQSPVILGDGDKTMLSMEELLEELVVIASAYKMPTDQITGSIMKIYDSIFENVEEACRLYPNDMGFLTVWLAKKALTTVHPELEKTAEQV